MEINTEGQDNVALDNKGLTFRGCDANETVERLLNTVARVEPTKPAEDKPKSDSSSNGNGGVSIPNIVINNNSKEFKDHIKEEDEPPISPTTDMPPPQAIRETSSTATIDLSKEIPHTQVSSPMDKFAFRLRIWCEGASLSQKEYSSLKDLLGLIKDISQLRQLPNTLDTLKKRTREQIPLLKMRKLELAVNHPKLPTRSRPTETIVFFNAIYLIKTILATLNLLNKMYQGIMHFVDKPTKLYHSLAWGSSARTTSKEFIRYPNSLPILPSDFIYFKYLEIDCLCRTANSNHIGRVLYVRRNYTSYSPPNQKGEILIFTQQVLKREELPPQYLNTVLSLNAPLQSIKLFLIKKGDILLQEDQV